jgi:oligosaccharide repeat unit polymerase
MITAIAVIMFVVLASFCTVRVAESVNLGSWYEVVLILVLMGVATIPALLAWSNRKLDVFEPVYLMSFLSINYFVLVPVGLIANNRFMIDGIDYSRELASCLLLGLLALISFDVGYYVGKARFQPQLKWFVNPDPNRIRRLSFVAIGVVIGMTLFYIRSNDIPLWAFNIFDERGVYGIWHTMATNNIGYMYSATLALVPLLLLVAAYRRSQFPGIIWITLWIGVGAFYIAKGNRSTVLTLFTATIVYFFLERKSRPRGRHLIISALVIFWFVGFIGFNRIGRTKEIEWVGMDRAWEVYLVSNSQILGLAMILDVFPTYRPYGLGQFLAANLLLPVPRVLWPGKPANLFYEDIALVVPRLSTPLGFGVWYADFWLVGPVVGMILLGLAYGYIYRAWQCHPKSRSTCLLLALSLFPLVTIYGWLPAQGMTWAGYMLVPLFGIIFLARR